MEVCEWLQLMADYGEAHRLPETDWLQAKAAQMRDAIETRAYDSDAGYYYLLYRAGEKKWYHSGCGINEASRELDVTPYYAAFVAGNDSRGQKVAEYARHVLMDNGVFPMPLSLSHLLLGLHQLSVSRLHSRRLLGGVILQLCPRFFQLRHAGCGICGCQASQRCLCAGRRLFGMVYAQDRELAAVATDTESQPPAI